MKKFINSLMAVVLTVFFYYIFRQVLFTDDTSYVIQIIKLLITSLICTFLFLVPILLVKNRNIFKPYAKKFVAFLPLLYQLVRRDFKAKYKRSVLGIAWTILNPMFTMLILSIVFSALFRFDIENFPVYLLTGQVIFNFFSEATNMAMSSIIGNASMLKKVSMPKYIFPLSRVLSSFVNLVLSLVALLLVMAITRFHFSWTLFLMIIPIFYVFLFSLGVGAALSAITVYFRDITYLYGLFLTALTYFTPLFYPINIIPEEFRIFISLNPMYHYVEAFRSVVLYRSFPTLWQNIICLSLGITSLTIGLYIFYKKQDNFILYM